MTWDDSPFARWGLLHSMRDGFATLAESTLWELEARHPQVVERRGDEIFLHLDHIYRVATLPDRAYVLLVEVPGEPRRAQRPHPAPDDGHGLAPV
jgi:hypothetical protein